VTLDPVPVAVVWGGHGVGTLLQPAQARVKKSESRSARVVIPVIESIHRPLSPASCK
jgi:hypothetical protein